MPNEPRFTIDGSPELEAHIEETCRKALASAREIIPQDKLEGLLLGGGYGRGQGGVLKTPQGDRPYNDLEFYVLVDGPDFLNRKRYQHQFEQAGEQLSPAAGLHVEFHITSLETLRKSRVSMFYYDLVTGHKRIYGAANLLNQCDHHKVGAEIPLDEATRLLMNRSSGLLFSENLLRKQNFSQEDADFVGRNHAKARLAFGDVVLTAQGLYHYNAIERQDRLASINITNLPHLATLQELHAAGVEFKLHPKQETGSSQKFLQQHQLLKSIGKDLWLWLENRRLKKSFRTVEEYVFSNVDKCPGTPPLRNAAVNFKGFGLRGLLSDMRFIYPRERLFSALPLLLWGNIEDPRQLRCVQNSLNSHSSTFPELVLAYQKIWERYN